MSLPSPGDVLAAFFPGAPQAGPGLVVYGPCDGPEPEPEPQASP
jgi:hypothetical protein